MIVFFVFDDIAEIVVVDVCAVVDDVVLDDYDVAVVVDVIAIVGVIVLMCFVLFLC